MDDEDILHLAPNSTDAKVFAGFANIAKGSNSSSTGASGKNFRQFILLHITDNE